MAKQIINVGTGPNTNTGDKIRVAFTKVNNNFTELYNRPVITDVSQLTDSSGILFSGNWQDLEGKPAFAEVATTGSFYDLIDYPEIANFYISFYVDGKPYYGETVYQFVVPQTISIESGFTGSFAKAGIAPSVQSVFTIKKNGTQIGTIAFAIGSTNGVFAGSAVTLVPSVVIAVDAPSSQDAALSNIAVTISALRG